MQEQEKRRHANRCFVVDRNGAPLGPCRVQRARKLRRSGRARLYKPEPYTIQLKDVQAADLDTSGLKTEVRVDPGRRHTGIAVVMLLEGEDRVVYQEELQHRTDISKRLGQRGKHRKRRRHEKWHRVRRFNNRRRNPDQLPPSMESVVSNQQTRAERLAEAAGTKNITIETARFDTAKILNPRIRGTKYQQGPRYKTHLRAYIAARDKHKCVYCGLGDWKKTGRFEIDHVVPRAAGGTDNPGNLAWACRPCNKQKGSRSASAFLSGKPKRLTAVLKRKQPPLACAGQQAWLCKALVERLRRNGFKVSETTGADTAANRKEFGIKKTHANDAACAGAVSKVTELRKQVTLSAVGHGRRKQVKGRPIGAYLAWRHQQPTARRRVRAPFHAASPRTVGGIKTGDRIKLKTKRDIVEVRAEVQAAAGRIDIRTREGRRASTTDARRATRTKGANGWTRIEG